jgi:hypothetical protein
MTRAMLRFTQLAQVPTSEDGGAMAQTGHNAVSSPQSLALSHVQNSEHGAARMFRTLNLYGALARRSYLDFS